jgi:hypothetical protein
VLGRYPDLGLKDARLKADQLRRSVIEGNNPQHNKIGQCFLPGASTDGHFEIFISPILDDEVRLADVLAHELVHVVTAGAGHGPEFKGCALAIGLEGPIRATRGGNEFNAWVRDELLPVIGKYPARAILQEEKKQTTRLIKCQCDRCGYIARVTRQWIDSGGPPTCTEDEIVMTVMLPEEKAKPEAKPKTDIEPYISELKEQLAAAKKQMAAAHPDKGGSHKAFIAARKDSTRPQNGGTRQQSGERNDEAPACALCAQEIRSLGYLEEGVVPWSLDQTALSA